MLHGMVLAGVGSSRGVPISGQSLSHVDLGQGWMFCRERQETCSKGSSQLWWLHPVPAHRGSPGNYVYEVLHIANGAVTTSLMPVCCCAG